jgi:hypothetical protein
MEEAIAMVRSRLVYLEGERARLWSEFNRLSDLMVHTFLTRTEIRNVGLELARVENSMRSIEIEISEVHAEWVEVQEYAAQACNVHEVIQYIFLFCFLVSSFFLCPDLSLMMNCAFSVNRYMI